MAWSVKEVASYRIFLDPRGPYPGTALLDLRPATGGAYWLWFTSTSPLPANTIGSTTGTAFFPLLLLDTVIELVRSEKPVYVQVNPGTGQFSLTTNEEPLGEGPVDVSP